MPALRPAPYTKCDCLYNPGNQTPEAGVKREAAIHRAKASCPGPKDENKRGAGGRNGIRSIEVERIDPLDGDAEDVIGYYEGDVRGDADVQAVFAVDADTSAREARLPSPRELPNPVRRAEAI